MAHNEIKRVTESRSLKMNWVGDNWEENWNLNAVQSMSVSQVGN